MRIEIKKFGTILSSRLAGKEAWLAAKAYSVPDSKEENVEIDFSGVQVLTPSWADEFLTPLKKMFGNKIKYMPYNNPTVKATLEILDEQHKER
ncbi:MAG: STAS-like domain-containing protein [Candidatus Magasanikbacteria bacterium]|nr:STAS-like domain-containing protein [Candidatus Magasanikbacteria bacterium]